VYFLYFFVFLCIFCIFCIFVCFIIYLDQGPTADHSRMWFVVSSAEWVVIPHKVGTSWYKCGYYDRALHRCHTSSASFRGVLAGRCAHCARIRRTESIGGYLYSWVVPTHMCAHCDPCRYKGNKYSPYTFALCRNRLVPSRYSGTRRDLQETCRPSSPCRRTWVLSRCSCTRKDPQEAWRSSWSSLPGVAWLLVPSPRASRSESCSFCFAVFLCVFASFSACFAEFIACQSCFVNEYF